MTVALPRRLVVLLVALLLAGAALTLRTTPAPAAEATLEGIDVGTSQANLDFAAAAQAGVKFAVVKAGGSQLSSSPYVSPYYARQVDSARSAGMKVGHYWLVGDFQTPTAAADYFVDHLHGYRAGDVLAVDDELLDGSKTLWDDAKITTFLDEVKRRVPTAVLWFYIGANDLRTRGPWTSTIATGAKLWVAVYGPNNGTYTGPPDIASAYPSYAVHQYTSKAALYGVKELDRDRASASAFTAAGGGTTTPPPTTTKLPKTSTQSDGVPGTVFWQRAQHWLAISDGYTGPIDGKPGTNTYQALQRDLAAHWGYTGPVDGAPGANTYRAWQRQAAAYGYTGPIDGEMGPNSYRAIATFLNEDRWD
ncbi:GH25 family lysozyme [Microlunatus antarcticus]|uniref:GH25 family lysozyme n=1 Tax=Microlunatus antarcticus TaxID=53388 RepID=UPI001618D754|nr:glycoside hydrolase family 25 protein [Microlunatus antarcticus]